MRLVAALALAAMAWVLPYANAWAQAPAQPSPDTLEACVVVAAGADDRRVLAQWMFSALALHPDLAGMAKVSDTQREEASRRMGVMLVRLLTVDCAEQAGRALRAGSAEMAFHRAFVRVGELAGEGLFNHPGVAAAGDQVVEHVDIQRIAELLKP
jgi:hypothetical protein